MMLRKKYILLFALLLLLCLSLAACGEEAQTPPPASSGTEPLSSPENVRSDMGLLRWDEVEHADGYCVRINDGEALFTETNTCEVITLPAQSTHHIQVWAKGDGEAYADSDWVPFTYRPDDYPADGYDENGLLYRLTGDKRGYEVSKGTSALVGTIDIRDEMFGLPVLRIAEHAFAPKEGEGEIDRLGTAENINVVTTAVHLPDRLESIGSFAFSHLTRLEEVEFPDSVTDLGRRTFLFCISLRKVVFPKNLKEIPDGCFDFCALEELNLPEGLERIGDYAFDSTYDVTSSFGRGHIEKNTQQFSEVILPSSVRSIGAYAFRACTRLEYVALPAGLTGMGTGCFQDCTALKEVLLPEGITCIGARAFLGCKALEKVQLPSTLTVIEAKAFDICKKLSEIRFPATLECIYGNAFSGTGLREVILPASLEQLSEKAFHSCNSMTAVWYEGSPEEWQRWSIPLWKGKLDYSKSTAVVYFYTETQPTAEGNYWRYVDGIPTKW